MKRVIVSGAFDDLKFKDFRFFEEASKLGSLQVLLWSDQAVETATGKPPKFPQVEREYFVQAIRYTSGITLLDGANNSDALPSAALTPSPCTQGQPSPLSPSPCTQGEGRGEGSASISTIWAVPQWTDTPAKRAWAKAHGVDYRVLSEKILKIASPPPPVPENPKSARKKVVVTGCFDWFHSGHVRFFEEVSELGDLYVVVGHDANIKLLKGEGHPLFPAVERRYIADSIRYVTQGLISTGDGWMDAEPEFVRIKPDIYAVNEDGDKPEKREFCQKYGIEYKVLKRLPKEGLPKRQSTSLRGF